MGQVDFNSGAFGMKGMILLPYVLVSGIVAGCALTKLPVDKGFACFNLPRGGYVLGLSYLKGDCMVTPDIVTQADSRQMFSTDGLVVVTIDGKIVMERKLTCLQAFGSRDNIKWSLGYFSIDKPGLVTVTIRGALSENLSGRVVEVSRCYL